MVFSAHYSCACRIGSQQGEYIVHFQNVILTDGKEANKFIRELVTNTPLRVKPGEISDEIALSVANNYIRNLVSMTWFMEATFSDKRFRSPEAMEKSLEEIAESIDSLSEYPRAGLTFLIIVNFELALRPVETVAEVNPAAMLYSAKAELTQAYLEIASYTARWILGRLQEAGD